MSGKGHIKKCRIEIYSRVTGFFRPVQVWNRGKQEEFSDRGKYDKGVDDWKKNTVGEKNC